MLVSFWSRRLSYSILPAIRCEAGPPVHDSYACTDDDDDDASVIMTQKHPVDLGDLVPIDIVAELLHQYQAPVVRIGCLPVRTVLRRPGNQTSASCALGPRSAGDRVENIARHQDEYQEGLHRVHGITATLQFNKFRT